MAACHITDINKEILWAGHWTSPFIMGMMVLKRLSFRLVGLGVLKRKLRVVICTQKSYDKPIDQNSGGEGWAE